MNEYPKWVDQAIQEYDLGNKDQSLDILLDNFDNMLLDGKVEEVKAIIKVLSMKQLVKSHVYVLEMVSGWIAKKENIA